MAIGKQQLREDISTARERMRVKFGGGKEIKNLTSHLWEGEVVHRMTTGSYGNGVGLVVLTDRRLLFVMEGLINKQTEDFPFTKISSIQWNSGLVTGKITVYASGNKSEISNVNKDDGKEITDMTRSRISEPMQSQSVPAQPASNQSENYISQIQQLSKLHQDGVLTDEEFSTKKAQILEKL